jgi:hypothetical protein
MRRRVWQIGFATVALLAGGSGARAAGHVFDYAVERFEADGNVHGPQDGVPDVIDEFDDGVLAPPQWNVGPGTAVETGGALHLKDPGFAISVIGLSPVSFEVSEVSTPSTPAFIQAGAGDLVVRSYWRPQQIGINHWVHMSIEWAGFDAWHFAGLALTNYDQALGDLYYPPWPTGYVMTAHHARIDTTGHLDRREHHVIDPAAITGPIVFELRYHETAHEISVAFSLDGGATFDAAFEPIPVSFDLGTAGIYLGADPRDGACPGDFVPTRATFSNLGAPTGDERFTLKGLAKSSVNMLAPNGLRILATDDGAGGAPLFDVTIPDGTTAYQQACDPRDGYFPHKGHQRYVNYSGALPPDCIPGSAQGLYLVDLRWNGTAKAKVKARGATIPTPVGPVTVGFYRPGEPKTACDGYVGHMTCRGGFSRLKCE